MLGGKALQKGDRKKSQKLDPYRRQDGKKGMNKLETKKSTIIIILSILVVFFLMMMMFL